MNETRLIVMGDLHCPFHDDVAIDAVLKYIRKKKPTVVVLNGDILDCYKVSRFSTDPKARSLKAEVADGRKLLHRIYRSIPKDSKLVWQDGNHEYRLKKYVWGRAPELDGLLDVPSLMRFDELDIEYMEYGHPLVIQNNIVIKHGSRYSSVSGGYSVKKEMDKEDGSVVMGHTHNLALIYRTYRNRTIFGVETGHLSNMSKIDYLQDKGGLGDWQQGFLELVETAHGLRPIIHEVISGEVI